MTTRGILNLILLLGIAALAAVVIYQPGITPPPTPIKLTTVLPEQIKHIQIEHAGKPTLTLEKQDGHWRITAPQALPADDGRVNSLLRLVQETSQARFSARPEELHKYKLEKPAILLTLDNLKFAFGDIDPINGRRYVQIGTTVHLITDMYYYQIDADLPSFVSTRLLPEHASITALTLPALSLSRDTQDHWQLRPEQAGISSDAIQALIDSWGNSSALWVKRYEKGTAQDSITVRFATPAQELRFDIMAKQPELILARPDIGMQYHLSPESAKTLLELSTASPTEKTPDTKPNP